MTRMTQTDLSFVQNLKYILKLPPCPQVPSVRIFQYVFWFVEHGSSTLFPIMEIGKKI